MNVFFYLYIAFVPIHTHRIDLCTRVSKCIDSIHMHVGAQNNRVFEGHWENLKSQKSRIIEKYFDKKISENAKCEIFCIEGVPAACMIYNKTNDFDDPVVESFFLNKGMLLMFDGGSKMRSELYKRYKNVNLRYAENRNDFLFF